MKRCMETERLALLKLKHGFVDASDSLSSWKGEDCCIWQGISCNNSTGHVTSLDLGYVAEEGKIDSSLCELQHLTFFDLSANGLRGKIPKCIGSLSGLTELSLAENELTGFIPHTLGNLSLLQSLDVSDNHLAASDVMWVSQLSDLRYLYMPSVNLSQAGDWPSSISKIHTLLELNLNECQLPQVTNPTMNSSSSSLSLQSLSLSHNSLNSSIFPWVLSVTSKAVENLDLSYNELEGRVSESFQNFCHLKKLWLSSNKLSGQVSDYIQHLHCSQDSMQELYLSDNPFSNGPLPDFSRFSSLNILIIRNASIVGPLQHLSGHLPNLTQLDLTGNWLSGPLSSLNFTKLVSLQNLYLGFNQLNGTLPYSIGQLSSLSILDVASNKLSGVVNETHLSNLSQLSVLDVSQNSLSFNLSSDWNPPFQPNQLLASSCFLGPNFPSWLKHQRSLDSLHIPNTGISGSFPKWFWKISPNLVYLNVSHNKLSGALPKLIPSLNQSSSYGSYLSWDLSFNILTGALPHFPPQLNTLALSNNMFSGSIYSFCAKSLPQLTYLDLSSNLLAGNLSDCWGQYKKLQVLNLENNSFSGKLPKSFGNLQEIEMIHLNNNNLSGAIPNLTLCSNLKLIDLGDNNLEGTIPAWIGHRLHHLVMLRLTRNKFHGIIPPSLCNLLHLQVLVLSKNNITGEIPQCFTDILALSTIRFSRENFSYGQTEYFTVDGRVHYFNGKAELESKGQNREYESNLGLMTIVDLSCNCLTGEIPQSITTLVALAILNLSRNHLNGSIPSNIGHMRMLESLDLSRNNLQGIIPTSLSNLTFLSYMNLSFNNLSGKIPESTQLDTFDPFTYVGNDGLCGPPTRNDCPESKPNPLPRGDGSIDEDGTVADDDEHIITFGFYVSLGLGFIAGFWGVCGALVLKSSWRRSYFKLFNNIK